MAGASLGVFRQVPQHFRDYFGREGKVERKQADSHFGEIKAFRRRAEGAWRVYIRYLPNVCVGERPHLLVLFLRLG